MIFFVFFQFFDVVSLTSILGNMDLTLNDDKLLKALSK